MKISFPFNLEVKVPQSGGRGAEPILPEVQSDDSGCQVICRTWYRPTLLKGTRPEPTMKMAEGQTNLDFLKISAEPQADHLHATPH